MSTACGRTTTPGLDFNGYEGGGSDRVDRQRRGHLRPGYNSSCGNKTVVTLDDGTEIWYCHQSSFGVSEGDEVRAGEVIGAIGSTGNVTGSHLHVEVRPGGGDPVEPRTRRSSCTASRRSRACEGRGVAPCTANMGG